MEGTLLIAHPLLNDGFFNRSVIYLTNKNEEGALGFVMNFKTQFKLRDVRPHVMNGNFPIYEGGPVAKDQLFFLHTLGEEIPESLHIKDGIYFGGDFNEMLYKIEHSIVKVDQVRFFVGYSGWGEGQLDTEIKKGGWLQDKGTNDDIFKIRDEELWKQKLESNKKGYGIFAEIGYDPSLN